MAYYFSGYGFLDPSTGKTPEEAFGGEGYLTISDSDYAELMQAQCEGKEIAYVVDSGTPISVFAEDQGCGACGCVGLMDNVSLVSNDTESAYTFNKIKMGRSLNIDKQYGYIESCVGSTTAGGADIRLRAYCEDSPESLTPTLSLSNDSTKGGALSAQGVSKTDIVSPAASSSNDGTRITTDADGIRLYHAKAGEYATWDEAFTDHLQVTHGGERVNPETGETENVSKLTLRPNNDYAADLGDYDHCFDTIHCNALKAYEKIYGTATQAIADEGGKSFYSAYASTITSSDNKRLTLRSPDSTGLSNFDPKTVIANILQGECYNSTTIYGGIGAIGLFVYTTSSEVANGPGMTLAGTVLHSGIVRRTSAGTVSILISSDTMAGTWRIMNTLTVEAGGAGLVLAVRIA